jgi:hypothetical protein
VPGRRTSELVHGSESLRLISRTLFTPAGEVERSGREPTSELYAPFPPPSSRRMAKLSSRFGRTLVTAHAQQIQLISKTYGGYPQNLVHPSYLKPITLSTYGPPCPKFGKGP